MVVKDDGGVEQSRALQANPSRMQGTISKVPVTNGQAATGFYTVAGPDQPLDLDDVEFSKQ